MHVVLMVSSQVRSYYAYKSMYLYIVLSVSSVFHCLYVNISLH